MWWAFGGCDVQYPSQHTILTCLATHEAGPELTPRREKVEVVAAGVVLRHGGDGAVKRRLAVVVSRVLRHIPRQLDHLRQTVF